MGNTQYGLYVAKGRHTTIKSMSRPRRMTVQSQPKAITHTLQRRMPHLRGGRIRIGGRFKIWSTWLWRCNEKCTIPLLVLAISLANTLHLNFGKFSCSRPCCFVKCASKTNNIGLCLQMRGEANDHAFWI